MKAVTVVLKDGRMLNGRGEVALDITENSLLVYGQQGAYMNFYWPGVSYYAVAEVDEDGLFNA